MALDLGSPVTNGYPIAGGEARIFERGAVITGAAGDVELTFDLPMIGNPRIAPKREMQMAPPPAPNALRRFPVDRDPNDPRNPGNLIGAFDLGAWALSELAITFTPGAWGLGVLHESIKAAFADRLALLPTGQAPSPVALEFLVPKEVVPATAGNPGRYGLPITALLADRQLYDVAVRGDMGQWIVIAPHAIYFRNDWTNFGIAHVTDTHIARRIDSFNDRLIALNRAAGAETMCNFNDRFRGFIRYANHLHSENRLDVILVTGDFIDYLFEDNDDPNGGGNALFARELLLGKRPGPTFPDVEELRVPIFLVPGNHDYRKNPYYLLFNIDAGLFNVRQVKNFSPYNIGWWEGLALSAAGSEPIVGVDTPWGLRLVGPDVPELSIETAGKMVEIDQDNRPFKTHLVDEGSYVINLGRHRIVMVDSAWDEGVVTSPADALRQLIGQGSEDEDAFVGGCPNSHGITDEQLATVTNTLTQVSPNALVIVGMHAPLLNPQDNTYPFFLRETQRAALRGYVERFLDSLDPALGIQSARERHETWWPETGNTEPSYIKRGDVDDLLDWGVSRGRAYELLRAIAGDGTSRAADVVLQGHTHRHNEFRIGRDNGQLAYFMDFYTQTPPAYYPTRFPTDFNPTRRRWNSDVTYVNVVNSAPLDSKPAPLPSGAKYKYSVDIPPYANPLSTAPDPAQWWADHRPLLLQTGALGPVENDQVSFAGFRVLTIKRDVIDKIHFIPMQRLHENAYRLSWDDAIK